MCTNPYEWLPTFRQDTLDAYIDVFVALVLQVEGLSDQQSLGYFFGGFKDDIQIKIKSHESVDLSCTMSIAHEIELEYQFLHPFKVLGCFLHESRPHFIPLMGFLLRPTQLILKPPNPCALAATHSYKSKYPELPMPKPLNKHISISSKTSLAITLPPNPKHQPFHTIKPILSSIYSLRIS